MPKEVDSKFSLKKIIPVITSIILVVVASIYFIEDRYTKKVETQEIFKKACDRDKIMHVQINAELYKLENIVLSQLERFSMKQDQRYLDELYRRKILYERMLEKDPDNKFLKDEYESIKEDIKRLRKYLEEQRNSI